MTNTTARILYYKFSDSSTRYYNGYSSPKHSCSSHGVLSITDVEFGDQTTYTCQAYGSSVSFAFIVQLILSGKLSCDEFQTNIIQTGASLTQVTGGYETFENITIDCKYICVPSSLSL